MDKIVQLPGAKLDEILQEKGWSQKDFALIIGRPEQMISEIINGKKQITPETSREFAQALGEGEEGKWYQLETEYQLQLAKANPIREGISERKELFEKAPIRDMIKRGLLNLNARAPIEDIRQELYEFFGVTNWDAIPAFKGNLRCSDANKKPVQSRMNVWGQHVKNYAKRQDAGTFNVEAFRASIPQLLVHAARLEDVARVPEFLAQQGVRFIIAKHFQKTYLDGAALYLDEEGKQPIIALTLRYDRIDSFWFSLLHECAHLVLDHQKGDYYNDQIPEEQKNVIEEQADAWANEKLLESESFDNFVASGKFTKKTISQYALQVKRHPGIIVGRLQYLGMLKYNQQRGFLEKVSEVLEEFIIP